MPFEAGHKNGKGRPKGSPNKITVEMKTRITDFLDENYELFEQSVKAMKPEMFAATYLSLLEYVTPKLARQQTELSGKDGESVEVIFRIATDQDFAE